MNYIDIVILIFVVIAAIKGFTRGLIISLASLAGLILGIIFSLRYAGNLAINLQHIFGSNSQVLFFASYAICFLIIVIFVHFVGKSLEKVIEIAALGFINRLAGVAFGIAKTLFIFSAIIYLVKIADPQSRLIKPETKQDSYFYQPLEWLLPATLPFLKSQLERMDDHHKSRPETEQEAV